MITIQHTPVTQPLLATIRMGKFQKGQKVSLDFFPPHSFHQETSNAETVLPDLESWGQNRPGRSGQSSRRSHFSIMHLTAHAATQQKCLQHIMTMLPPAPAQQPVLPQDKVAHIILLARTKSFQIGQGINKQQLLQPRARCGGSPLLLAALNLSSPWRALPIVPTLKDFPSNSGSHIAHSGRPAVPAALPSELHFPGIALQLTDTHKQTASAMALHKAKQMEVDWVHSAQ